MAKPKKPSMLSRQRQLRQQQQQVRRASSNNLPPRGGSGGGRGGAVTRSGGATQARGGAIVKAGQSTPTNTRVVPVKVRAIDSPKPSPTAAKPGVTGTAARGALTSGSKGLGRFAGPIGTGIAIADQARRVFNPKDNIITRLGDLGNSIENGGRPGPGHSRYQAPQAPKPKPKPTAKQISDLTDKGGIYNMNGTGNVSKPRTKAETLAYHQGLRAKLQKDYPVERPKGQSSGSGSGSGSSSRPAPKPAAPKAPDKFKGTAEEGRKLWIDTYSADKYKDQAIGKKARQMKADMSAGPSANAQEYGDYLKRKNKGK